MPYLVAVTGLAGVGKTTAVGILSQLTGGEALYLGATVLDTVKELGLSQTPENERAVRLKLRAQRGQAALAELQAHRVLDVLRSGLPVLVDAIFVQSEFDLLASKAKSYPSYLLHIEASLDNRVLV